MTCRVSLISLIALVFSHTGLFSERFSSRGLLVRSEPWPFPPSIFPRRNNWQHFSHVGLGLFIYHGRGDKMNRAKKKKITFDILRRREWKARQEQLLKFLFPFLAHVISQQRLVLGRLLRKSHSELIIHRSTRRDH